MFATIEFYTGNYLLGREAVLNAAEFPLYERSSSQVIKKYTFDNIDPNEPIPEVVQMCCCELAEHLFHSAQEHNSIGNIKSESVGKQSTTYTTGVELEQLRKQKEKSIIYNWLSGTGLLYCGVRGC